MFNNFFNLVVLLSIFIGSVSCTKNVKSEKTYLLTFEKIRVQIKRLDEKGYLWYRRGAKEDFFSEKLNSILVNYKCQKHEHIQSSLQEDDNGECLSVEAERDLENLLKMLKVAFRQVENGERVQPSYQLYRDL